MVNRLLSGYNFEHVHYCRSKLFTYPVTNCNWWKPLMCSFSMLAYGLSTRYEVWMLIENPTTLQDCVVGPFLMILQVHTNGNNSMHTINYWAKYVCCFKPY